jgi:hypothetical protein
MLAISLIVLLVTETRISLILTVCAQEALIKLIGDRDMAKAITSVVKPIKATKAVNAAKPSKVVFEPEIVGNPHLRDRGTAC